MSKSTSWGLTDTPINGVTSLNFQRGLLNFSSDFSVSESSPKECKLVNLTSPLDRVERVTIATTPVASIYKDSGIDPKVQAPSKKGTQVLVKIQDILSVSDSADPGYRIDLPLQAHMVLRFPNDETITADVILKQLGRMISCIYDTGSTATSRLNEIIRGALESSEV